MPDCDSLDLLVTPYVDGDIGDADRRRVDDHLRLCAACHSRVAAERAVRELVRTRAPELAGLRASDSLRTRCSAAAAAARGQRSIVPAAAPPSWRARLVPYALAASLILVVGGAFLYQATDKSTGVLAAELTADHVKCFAMNALLGTHDEARAVEGAMLASFDWQMHLPDHAERMGLELVGARPCLYGEGKIAHIMYRHRGQPVSLFMLPRTARRASVVDVLGHEASVWCVGNRTFVLVTREARPEVDRLASFVQAALR